MVADSTRGTIMEFDRAGMIAWGARRRFRGHPQTGIIAASTFTRRVPPHVTTLCCTPLADPRQWRIRHRADPER
jgi:hypothetical protein